MEASKIEHLVVDTGGFLKNAPVQTMARDLYTLRSVIYEVRDKETRRTLSMLLYSLKLEEPSPKYVSLVTEFSKKTGDFPSLSATDLRVLALTYELEAKHVGTAHLCKEPKHSVQLTIPGPHTQAPVKIEGFHLPNAKKKPIDSWKDPIESVPADPFGNFLFWREPPMAISTFDEHLLQLLNVVKEKHEEQTEHEPQGPTEEEHTSGEEAEQLEQDLLNVKDCGEGSGSDEVISVEDESDEDDDGEGWITPSNIRELQKDSCKEKLVEGTKVACLTTDFAMQNVLLNLGLTVVSVTGLRIREARTFTLRCFACFTLTWDMQKQFCIRCGNATLKRVPVSRGPDGSLVLYLSRNPKVLNRRGLKFSLPMPKGGKHAHNPILCADQRLPHERVSRKALARTGALEPDYDAGVSPFAVHDLYSRWATLGVKRPGFGSGRQRINPNVPRGRFGPKRR
uniref:RNA-binding protein NOB1 isoform X2 n=1 Tax=Myxine glutinosa TaxID=7769 RepID=UPI00358E7E47